MKNPIKTIILLAVIWFFGLQILWLLPDAGLAQSVPTLSAGIGKDDRGAHRDYSLKLVFGLSNGPFLAGINVSIFDSNGAKIVDSYSKGPWFYVKLPDGNYRVVAKRKDGKKSAASVEITAEKQKKVYLTWSS